jgi:glycine cleavage system aminomethyltransferase T/glycine/D-amino acid oxidase-like deaminating enzyme
MSAETDLPETTETLIIGAGIVGCSVAYHLGKLGHRDVTVVDAGSLARPRTGGPSADAPGGVFQTAPDRTASTLAQETRELAAECGAYEAGGSVEVATTESRLRTLDRRMDQAAAWGVEDAERLTPDAVAERLPFVDAGAVRGGYAVPTDGRLSALDFLAELRDRAESQGATVHSRTTVTDVETAAGAVDTVVTDRGSVETTNVVVAADGMTPAIGEMVGVDIPLAPVVHRYAVTEPIDGLAGVDSATGEQPWFRYPDGSLYARRHGDALGIGVFSSDPTVLDPHDVDRSPPDAGPISDYVPGEGSGGIDGPDSEFCEAFAPALEELATVVPRVEGAALAAGVDGLIDVTPDGNPILGETPGVDGFWVAAGLQTAQAGGAGRALAELLDRGTTAVDIDPWHAARFQPHSGAPSFVREQCRLTAASETGVPEAGGIESTGRTLRESPFYRYQDGLGANFYDLRYGGWKRPMSFGTNETLVEEYEIPERGGRGDGWSSVEAVEHLAVRDRVGLCDLTSFSTFDIVGPGAAAFCQRVFSNDMALSVGGVTYTLLLDEAGGIHGDLTVVRRGKNRFHAISNSGGAGTKQLARLRRQAAGDDSVTVSNQIGGRCGVSVTGPNAREMLDPVVNTDLDNDAFPYFSAAETYVGEVPALAVRVSYVGELGWEFHTSMEYGAELWETLWAAGGDHGVVPFGDGALVSMRLEKGFPAYGVDISPAYTPFEAGLDHTVDLDTEFVGREALLKQRDDGRTRERAVLTLEDPEAVVGSGTPVFDGDRRVGHVTSAGEGYSVDEFILYAYMPPAYGEMGTDVEVQHENERYAATVRRTSLYDPERERLLS